MKQLISIGALALVCGCSHDATPVPVAAAERARANAIERKDAAAYGRLAAADLLIVERDGALATRADRMAEVASGEAIRARRGEGDVDVRTFGNVAILMGRSVWQKGGEENHDYFSRIWVRRNQRWQMVAAHYTDITDSATSQPSSFSMPDNRVPALPIASTPQLANAEAEVRRTIREQHRAYWAKNQDRYRQYAGWDLLRVAENGVRTREQLIKGIGDNARLPAPPSDQSDVRVRVYENTAISTWLDQGIDVLGRPSRNRFTVVFGHRNDVWQMVHIQSTGVKQ